MSMAACGWEVRPGATKWAHCNHARGGPGRSCPRTKSMVRVVDSACLTSIGCRQGRLSGLCGRVNLSTTPARAAPACRASVALQGGARSGRSDAPGEPELHPPRAEVQGTSCQSRLQHGVPFCSGLGGEAYSGEPKGDACPPCGGCKGATGAVGADAAVEINQGP